MKEKKQQKKLSRLKRRSSCPPIRKNQRLLMRNWRDKPKNLNLQSTVEDDVNSSLAPKEDAKKPEERKDNKEGETKRRGSPDTEIADDDALINIQEALGELIYLADLTDHDLEDKMAYLASEECIKLVWSDI